jgi:hypothetical protein
MITDSKMVDLKQLDPKKAYLQVTFVQPHFPEHELKRRLTYFERNTSLKNFVYVPSVFLRIKEAYSFDCTFYSYETPFILGGKKAHGSLDEQRMRRTYLTIERVFPFVKVVLQTKTQKRLWSHLCFLCRHVWRSR